MKRSSTVYLLVAAAGVALLVGACGAQRVGEMQRESQSVDLENAQSVHTNLRMDVGELNVTGGGLVLQRRRLEAQGGLQRER